MIHFPQANYIEFDAEHYYATAIRMLTSAETLSDIFSLDTYLLDYSEVAGGFGNVRQHIHTELNTASQIYIQSLTVNEQLRIAIKASQLSKIRGPFGVAGMYGYDDPADWETDLSLLEITKRLNEWLAKSELAYKLNWLVAKDMLFDVESLINSTKPLLKTEN